MASASFQDFNTKCTFKNKKIFIRSSLVGLTESKNLVGPLLPGLYDLAYLRITPEAEILLSEFHSWPRMGVRGQLGNFEENLERKALSHNFPAIQKGVLILSYFLNA